MALREVLIPWTEQPQEAVEPAQDLSVLYFAPTNQDLCSKVLGVFSSATAARNIATAEGVAAQIASFNDRISINNSLMPVAFLQGARISIAGLITASTSGSTRTYFLNNRGSSTASSARRGAFSINVLQSTHTVRLTVNGNTSNTVADLFSLELNKVMFLEILCRSDGYDYYSNYGSGFVSVSDGLPESVSSIPPGGLTFGQASSLGEPGHNAAALLHVGYSRTSQGKNDSPWQLFAPRTLRIPVAAPSSAPTTRLREVVIPWDSQPQESVGVDWGNPLTAGLVFCTTGADQRDIVGGRRPATKSSTVKPSRMGLLDQYANQQTTFAHSGTYDVLSDITVAAFIDVDALTNYGAIISKGSESSTNIPYELRLGSGATDSRIAFTRASAGAFRSHLASGSNLISAGAKSAFVGVTQFGPIENVPTFYVDGLAYSGTSATGSATGSATTNSGLLYLGKRGDAVTYLAGGISIVAVWNRVLSAAEMGSFRANPWQLFAPRTLRIPVSGGSGRLYYVIGPNSGWSTPSAAEVMAGQLSGGSPATASGSELSPTITTDPFTFAADATGLTAGQDYRVAYVWSDA